MLTQNQIKDLASYYQIDEFTIFREYLQLIFLNYLYQEKQADKIFFKGGTAIHLILNSPRFSEDLDFSTTKTRNQIKQIIKTLQGKIKKELPNLKINLLYQGKKSARFKLKYKAPNFKYPFTIKIDFSYEKILKKSKTTALITKFPIILFPIIIHLSKEEILAEKIRAFSTRGQGRDIFDLWFLLKKGVKFEKDLINNKLKSLNKKFNKEKFIKKIENFPEKRLRIDLNQFLPQKQRKIIKILKKEFISNLKIRGVV